MSTRLGRLLAERSYDASIRPGMAAARSTGACSGTGSILPRAEPDQVHVQFVITRVHSISTNAKSYGIDGYFRIQWTDPRLRFDTSSELCNEPEPLLWDLNRDGKVWLPDLYFEDSTKDIIGEASGQYLGSLMHIYRNGSLMWSQRARLEFKCPMDVTDMPWDTQCCPFRVGLYSQQADTVVLAWKAEEQAMLHWQGKSTSEWTVTNVLSRSTLMEFA
jgi:hypothetical protein